MKKINLLDVFIILIVLVACAVGYKFIKKTDNVITDDPTTKVVYQVRTNETIENVYDMIIDDILNGSTFYQILIKYPKIALYNYSNLKNIFYDLQKEIVKEEG